MKISPVSGDMLLKVGLVGLVLGGIVIFAYRKRNLVNPLSPDNVVYSGITGLGSAIFTEPDAPGKNADGTWSLGGALFDWLNPGTAAAVKAMSGPVETAQPGGDHYLNEAISTGVFP